MPKNRNRTSEYAWFASHAVYVRNLNRNPDLLEPYILRSLSNIKIVSIHASCTGCHFVAIDVDGIAWLFGRNGFSCLGVEGIDAVSESAPLKLRASDLGAEDHTRFVDAACGRNHTLLIASDGTCWTAGANNLGQACVLLLSCA